jgi:ABC-2 type transport system permease protein
MKNNLFLLTRILLKGGFNFGKKKGKGIPQWIVVALLALAFTPMVGQVVYFSSAGYDMLSMVGIQGIILSLALALSAFVIFFFGIFYVLNTFYFTNDIESLLPLP